MKTIEERVADAIDELESLLSHGQSVEAAISTASSYEGLKPDVLRVRAERVLGDLRTVKARNDVIAQRLSEAQKANRAIYEFAESNAPNSEFADWFRKEVGREPTEAEDKEMERLMWEALLRKVKIEI